MEAASTLCAHRCDHSAVPWTALETRGRPLRPGNVLLSGQSALQSSPHVENSQRASCGVEVCRSPLLSGHTLLRLFIQPDSDLFELAEHSACGGGCSSGRGGFGIGGGGAGGRVGACGGEV